MLRYALPGSRISRNSVPPATPSPITPHCRLTSTILNKTFSHMLSHVFGIGRRSFNSLSNGNPRPRHFVGGGRRPHLQGLCRRPARATFRPSPRCSTRWPRRKTAIAPSLLDHLPEAIRRAHPADPARARQRLLRTQAGLADAAARRRGASATRPRPWRSRRDRFYLSAAKRHLATPRPQAARRSAPARSSTIARRAGSAPSICPTTSATPRRRDRAAPVRAAPMCSPGSPA